MGTYLLLSTFGQGGQRVNSDQIVTGLIFCDGQRDDSGSFTELEKGKRYFEFCGGEEICKIPRLVWCSVV